MKYLVLGTGPSGLAFANRLLDKNIDSFTVLEAENEAGGLCRSKLVDGAPFDIGGGHFLDVKRPIVNDYLFRFMSESEWKNFDRKSAISLNSIIINHPIEANIWQMEISQQVEYLKSIAVAGCNIGVCDYF